MEGTTYTNGVIDTDILIDATKRHQDATIFLVRQQVVGIQISIISAIELVVGCRNKVELTQTQKFLQDCTVLPVTANASQIAYRLVESFYLSHGLIMADAFIAATALAYDLTLYTRNTRHFRMIPQLKINQPY
jgi:predicted nucleic acid-binding protein